MFTDDRLLVFYLRRPYFYHHPLSAMTSACSIPVIENFNAIEMPEYKLLIFKDSVSIRKKVFRHFVSPEEFLPDGGRECSPMTYLKIQ